MAGDLEALFEHYLARGLPEEEAARGAEERVLASPAEVRRLVALHATGARGWLAWLAGRVRRDLDLFLFVAGVLPVLALAVGILLPRLGAPGAGPFEWSVLGIGVAVAGLSLRKLRQLAPRRDAGRDELREGLSGVLFLGGMGLGVAALGFVTRLCSLSLRLSRGDATERDWGGVASEIARAGTLLGTGILLAMGAGLLWFVLANRVAALERVEREILLGERST